MSHTVEADSPTAAERLARFMVDLGPERWVSMSEAFEAAEVGMDPKSRDAGFVVSDARKVLRVKHKGLTIVRDNGRLQVTASAEETRDYELSEMHRNINRELARRAEHLDQIAPHMSTPEEAAKLHDAHRHILKVKVAVADQKRRDEKKGRIGKVWQNMQSDEER